MQLFFNFLENEIEGTWRGVCWYDFYLIQFSTHRIAFRPLQKCESKEVNHPQIKTSKLREEIWFLISCVILGAFSFEPYFLVWGCTRVRQLFKNIYSIFILGERRNIFLVSGQHSDRFQRWALRASYSFVWRSMKCGTTGAGVAHPTPHTGPAQLLTGFLLPSSVAVLQSGRFPTSSGS